MTDRDIIKQLQTLRFAEPDKVWSSSARANILAYAQNSMPERRAVKSFPMFVFMPNRAFVAVAGFVVFFVVVFALGSMLKGGDESNYQALITGGNNVGSESEKLSGENGVAPSGVNVPEAPASKKRVFANTQGSAEVKNKSVGSAQTLGSSRVSEEDPYVAFQTSVRERLNRVWVLAQDGQNDSALAVAQEAEDLYKAGDYDGALRAVSAAEGMLK